MSIKAGDLLHVGNQVLIDRAQTAGPGTLNVPTTKIYELGNYLSVATVRDNPDLTFTMESLDASAALEALLTGRTFSADAAGHTYDLSTMTTMDVASMFKPGRTASNAFDVVGSVAAPFLTVESIAYAFGLTEGSRQTVTLRGDSIYYAKGMAYVQEAAGTGAANQTLALTHTALPYNGDTVAATTRYALSVSLIKSQTRLVIGTDYQETATGAGAGKSVTVTLLKAIPTSETVRVTYQSDVANSYPQASHEPASGDRPAALRGRDIEVRVGGYSITDRWSAVQSVTADWRVQLTKDEELGSATAVSQDYDVPSVTGTVVIKPRNVQELLNRVHQIAGVSSDTEVVGAQQVVPLPLEIVLHSPADGHILKTLSIPDARFTLPGFSGRVQTKLEVTFNWESDAGILLVTKNDID